MGKREKLNKLEEEMLRLKATMQDDGRAMKCFKMNKSFAELYPEDYEEYLKANERYNELETERDTLKAEIEKEEQDEARKQDL